MCGIVGLYSPSYSENSHSSKITDALHRMAHRGPDNQGVFQSKNCILGHTRLSIIDTSNSANQPMISDDGNFILIFNGEIFNFQSLKKELEKEGIKFKTNSDSEVLLRLLIKKGHKVLNELNGFFAFAFYDKINDSLLIVRDRFGEKPLKYYYNNKEFFFASDLGALAKIIPSKKLDYDALKLYLQFNYIPAPFTIYKNVNKLMPGEFLIFSKGVLEKNNYYQTKTNTQESDINTKLKLEETLFEAVKNRMISDVPLGSFLSGGIDSSIISGIAKDIDKDIQTFSIGFPNEKHFDETAYALAVSKHLNTKHEVFNVTGNQLISNFDDFIDKMDEPFADSSALAVYELCLQTKSKITVALSGDGADELFGGYHKHLAHKKSLNKNFTNLLLKNSNFILKNLKGSRDSKIGNKIRQAKKYAHALNLSEKEKYILWASQLNPSEVSSLLLKKNNNNATDKIDFYFESLHQTDGINPVLLTDIRLVLANDMLVKVDLMSMANSLEVRPPFLDVNVVEFALSLNSSEKIRGNSKKNILKETYSKYLPSEIINRPKKGFEVPLIKWYQNEFKNNIENNWLNNEKIKSQGIFDLNYISKLKADIFSSSPGNSAATVWAIIVFQEWISKNEIEL